MRAWLPRVRSDPPPRPHPLPAGGELSEWLLVTWFLITTLCLKFSATEADCRRDYRGPYLTFKVCQSFKADQKGALQALADELDTEVLFLGVRCEKGMDG